MVGTNTLLAVHLKVDDLARAELCDEDFGVHGGDGTGLLTEVLGLLAVGLEDDITSVD